MKKRYKIDFKNLIKDMESNYLSKLKNESHHGINRYKHSLRVAKGSYYIARFLHFSEYEETTKAAMLHDFFLDTELEGTKPINRHYLHPRQAAKNASKIYNINSKQKNIIEAHMFPLGFKLPRSKEAVLVSCVDKGVATYELIRFKLGTNITLYFIFLSNLIKM